MVKSLAEAREIFRYRELLRNLVLRDIKVRYKRSFLGFVWVMLNPLLMMLIMNIVFSEVFRVSTKNYTAYLLSGIILWNFFSQGTSTAVPSMVGNSNLIKKIYIPKAVFPLSVVLSATINFAFSLVPLVIIFLITGTEVSPHVYLLPVVFVLVGLFSYGISLALSTLTTFFHDTIYIYDVLLLAWMYATPIFYPAGIIPQKFGLLLQLNPLYHFITVFRGALYLDVPSLAGSLFYGSLFSIASVAAGWLIYNRFKDRLVYYL
jgi:ABC-type polysaccharide/polyol phosphate export permease